MRKKIEELVEQLNKATYYYNLGTPIMTDKEWDNLYFQLEKLEKEENYILVNSPTQSISYEVVNQLEKVEHNHKMLSLDKTKDLDIVKSFIGKNDYIAMCKMDGLTCSLRYLNGELVGAETRGNGIVGENILHNAKIISSIPNKINFKEELVIDGEIICTYADFEEFSKDYKNPRNFASGSIRLLDSKECSKRKLSFVAWDVIKGFNNKYFNHNLQQLQELGFSVVPYSADETYYQDIKNLTSLATDYGYPIDGIVFKFNNIEYGKSLGETAHHFKNAIAYKFYDETYPTKLIDIEWTMGRTGTLTPVAVFEPIDMDGSIVERASLHNISIMDEIFGGPGPFVGQEIFVFKANMIIPQIKSASDTDKGVLFYMDKRFIEIPEVCPICGGPVIEQTNIDSTFLVCTNPGCNGKLINRLDHFCSKKGLDIKGLSKATLEKLINWGWVNNITDIFNLEQYKKDWIAKPGFGVKSVENVLQAIENSKTCTFINFVSALGIPLIGQSAAKELNKHFDSWQDFYNEINNNFAFYNLPSFGFEMHNSIINFDYSEANELFNNYLNISNNNISSLQNNNTLEGQVFVITGRLTQFKNRSALQQKIEELGGKVSGSISSNTTYLINNNINSTSSKNKDAKNLGVPIITEIEFIEKFLTI